MILDAHKNAHSCPQNCIKIENMWSFSSSFLFLLHKYIYISFFSCLFLFCFLDTQKCFTFRIFMKNLWASKKLQYICMEMAHSGTFSLYTFLSPHQKKKESPRKKPFSFLCFFHFSSFLFLHAQKRLTFRVIMASQPVGKQSAQQIDDTFSIYAIAQRERMHLLKSNWILISSLQGQMYDWSGTAPTVSNKMTHKGFLAAFQVSMLAAYWKWQYAMFADDTGMPS